MRLCYDNVEPANQNSKVVLVLDLVLVLKSEVPYCYVYNKAVCNIRISVVSLFTNSWLRLEFVNNQPVSGSQQKMDFVLVILRETAETRLVELINLGNQGKNRKCQKEKPGKRLLSDAVQLKAISLNSDEIYDNGELKNHDGDAEDNVD